jgi:hypothetical protein
MSWSVVEDHHINIHQKRLHVHGTCFSPPLLAPVPNQRKAMQPIPIALLHMSLCSNYYLPQLFAQDSCVISVYPMPK